MSELITTKIPTEKEADRVIRIFTADGCTAVKKEETDGTWTVVANCPEQILDIQKSGYKEIVGQCVFLTIM